jgi:hypothetical protein
MKKISVSVDLKACISSFSVLHWAIDASGQYSGPQVGSSKIK